MRILKIIAILVLLIFPIKSRSEQLQANTELTCPNLPLLQNVSKEELRHSTNSIGEPLFLSSNYCFVFYSTLPTKLHDPKWIDQAEKRFLLSYRNGKNIVKSYNKAYSSLSGVEQKLTFVHLFLHKLTRSAVVVPSAVNERQPLIMIAVNLKPYFDKFLLVKLTKDMGNLEALHKLQQLQQNPPKAEDYPALSKLVDAVLDPKAVISDDKLFELSSIL